jgi:hypothetical protein
MGIATAGTLYLVPPSQLGKERRALLDALGRAEAVPFRDPLALASVSGRPGGPTLEEIRRSMPPPAEAIHVLDAPEVIEIARPDCTCRVVRFEPEGDFYRVDVDDRRFGADRDLSYRMVLRPSKQVDAAWAALVGAAERGATRRHLPGPETQPLEAFRTLGVARGPARAAN